VGTEKKTQNLAEFWFTVLMGTDNLRDSVLDSRIMSNEMCTKVRILFISSEYAPLVYI
jgi:hypothetical protein